MRVRIHKILSHIFVRLRLDKFMEEAVDIRLRSELAFCGKNVGIRQPCRIEGPEQVFIDDDVSIAAFVHVWGQGGVTIGRGTMVASHVAITSLTHDPDATVMRKTLIQKPVKIGENVWIGAHAVIFPGVTIGKNAVIGAGSIVRTDVAPDTIVTGVPARLKRKKNVVPLASTDTDGSIRHG